LQKHLDYGEDRYYASTSMQSVRISVFEERGRDEKLVESRFVDVESDRKLNRATAKRLLAREFSLPPYSIAFIETPRGWRHSKTSKPTEKCGYHYVWLHYYVTAA
jgi:hypothetical protein